MALLDILNQVTGTKGKSVREIETIYNGSSSNLTLSTYDIEADYNAQAWEPGKRVYFQSTPQRLALIQQKLQENLNKIESDITSNIGALFDLIEKNSAAGGLGIEASLGVGEDILINSNNENEILQAGADLEQTISNLLTSDAALDTIINAFIAKFTLDIQRLDNEIFNLLDDKDGNFSNGSTDASAAKYIVISKNSPALIADNINQVFDAVFKTPYEDDHGTGSWTNKTEKTLLYNFFQKGTLNLSPGLIDKIIEDKAISEEDLAGITKQSQFLGKYNYTEFLALAGTYYGTSGDTDATIKQLSLDHLEAITPKYFEDNRTLQDILSGKATNNDSSNINRAFQSASGQIKSAAESAIQLLGSGFDKIPRNNFETFVRNNPILAIDHLETQKASLSNPQDIAIVDNKIKTLIEFNKREVASQIQWYTEKNKRSTDPDAITHNNEILDILQGNDGILSKLNNYNSSSSAAEIIELYNSSSELKLETLDLSNGEAFNDAALDQIITSGLKIQNVHKALYANEMLEAGKLNANHSGKKLAEPAADGTIPESKEIAPPSVSPTISSGIIAVIGNEILHKANSLINDSSIPDSAWLTTNSTILKNINDRIPTLNDPTATAGKVFLDNLRIVFRDVIKQFVTSDVQNFKDSVDKAKIAINSQDTLVGDSSIILDSNNTDTNLNNIEQALNGDIFAGTNFIHKAGLGKVKPYLDDVVQTSKLQINITNTAINVLTGQIQNKLQEIAGSTDPDEILILQAELQALQNALQAQQDQLTIQQNRLDQTNDLLDKPGKIKDLFKQLNDNVSSVIDLNNPLDVIKSALLDNYKTKLQTYSDKLTDHFRDDTDANGVTNIEERFQNALVDTSLDLNQDGINDFRNIQDTIDKISELGNNMADVFGSKEKVNGDMKQQSIKRLILMMFVMSMLEYSDWEYNKAEADLSRYAVPE